MFEVTLLNERLPGFAASAMVEINDLEHPDVEGIEREIAVVCKVHYLVDPADQSIELMKVRIVSTSWGYFTSQESTLLSKRIRIVLGDLIQTAIADAINERALG